MPEPFWLLWHSTHFDLNGISTSAVRVLDLAFSWHALHCMRLCLAWLNFACGNQEAGTFVGS